MSHIFISYSKKNKKYARKLADHLIASGFDIWIDDRIDYGENWERVIFQAIDACSAFVVIMTPESYESDWVLRECQYADRRKKPQYPLLLEGEGFPRYMTTQYADVTDGSLPPEEFLDRLAEHAPRRTVKGADVTPAEVSEEKPSPSGGVQTVRISRPHADAPLSQSQTKAPKRTPFVIGAGVLAALALVVLVIALSSQNQGVTPEETVAPTATTEEVAQEPTTSLDQQQTSVVPAPTATTEELAQEPTTSLDQQSQQQTNVVPYVSSNGEWEPVIHSFNNNAVVLVPPGCFLMGSETGEPEEAPVEHICIDLPYWIGYDEVTNDDYRQCVDAGVCTPPQDAADFDDPLLSEHPVVNVTWEQARIYAEWSGGRLPTEAEWEYAARGPDGMIYPWGTEFDHSLLNYCDQNCSAEWRDVGYVDEFTNSAPAGYFPDGASWVGAVDMSGNVREWTQSLYSGYPYRDDDGRNGLEDTSSGRVSRSGSFYSEADDTRTTQRFNSDPVGHSDDLGFRIVIDYSEQIAAEITHPQAGMAITTDENIFGTAIYSPLLASSYRIEITGGQFGENWEVLNAEHSGSVIDGWLETIYPHKLDPGDYRIRLHIPLNSGEDVYSAEVPLTIPAQEQTPTQEQTSAPQGSIFNDRTHLSLLIDYTGNLNQEYIAILNYYDAPLDLTGWTIEDEDGNLYTFPSFQLAPQRSVHVNTREGSNNEFNVFWGLPNAIWSPGERAVLRDASGNARQSTTAP